MRYQNTDRQVDALYTNYPFTHNSTKLVYGSIIPNTMFISVRICVQQTCKNLHISSIQQTAVQLITIYLQDTQRFVNLKFQLVPGCQVCFVLDQLGVPCGLIQCKPQLYECFLAILQTTGNSLAIPAQSFIFLPQCVSAAATKGLCRAVLNNVPLQNQIIQLKKNLIYQKSDSSISFAMYPDDLEQQGIRLVYINRIPASNKHIVIKHNTLSDLRVVTKDNIQLVGVADV